MTEKIDEILQNRYRLDKILGKGGMGTVYQGEDELLKRTVAIKLLSAKGLGTEGKARMLREAQSAALLNHPNIVTVYDAGEDMLDVDSGSAIGGTPFVVMELIEGQNLAEKQPEDLDQIVDIAVQLCSALAHAHKNDIIHRDLKPENVLLTEDGVAKLVDFGLARSVTSRLTTEGTIAGTLSYMAPELALGQSFDGRVDLYSLGVMLYELTTGQLPFTADDPVSVITQHLYAPVVPPRAHKADLPAALDILIVKLLSKNPDDRPADAGEVLAHLKRIGPEDQAPEQEGKLTLLDRFVRGRLVGRDNELAEARSLWRRSMAGEGQMLLISGEPGIGKTRLTRELITQVEVSGGLALVGECYAEGGGPYAPFAQIIRRSLSDGQTFTGELPDHIMADLINLSPNLWSQYPNLQKNPPLDPQLEQQRLFENMVGFCQIMSQQAPLLIVIDDAHWADSGSLSMLRYLARRVGRYPFMIVATYREVELDENLPFNQVLVDISRERLASRVKLARFSKRETEDLLATLFAEEITPGFLEGIYRETEGNPFFIEEVCKALVEGGQLYFEDGSWQRPKMDDMIIPQSVRVAIQSRIANLPEEDQEILRLAAILGREFDFDTLVEASELGEDQLIDALERAEHAQLIEPASGVSFTFAHALIPSTLVEGVHMLRRRRLHRRAAAAIERLRPEDFEALAYHFGEAGDEARALTYYTKAGEKASKVYANQEAASHFQAALNLADSEEEQAYLHSELGVVLARESRFEEADKSWRKAIIIYEDEGNLVRIAWSYARMARAAWDAGDTIGGFDLCREGLTAAEDAPDSPEMADLLHETARAYVFSGRQSEGQPLCERALEMAEQTGAVVVQAEALITMALLGEFESEETVRLLKQAIQLCQEHNLMAQESRACNNISISLGIHGDIKECREYLRRASELSVKVGDLGMRLFAATSELYWAIWQGELDYVGDQLTQLEVTLESMIDPGTAGNLFSELCAFWLWAKGDVNKPLSRLRELKAELVEGGDLQGLFNIAIFSLGPLVELGEYDEAEVNIDEAIHISDQGIGSKIYPRMLKLSLPRVQADAEMSQRLMEEIRKEAAQNDSILNRTWLYCAEAHYLATKGQWQEANKSFKASIELGSKMDFKLMAHWIRTWSERLIDSKILENLSRSREHLERARTLFEEMGAPYYIGKVVDLSEGLDDILGKGRTGVR